MIFFVVLISAPAEVVGIVSSFLDFVVGPTTEETTHKAHPRGERPKPAEPSAEPGSTGNGDGTPTYVYVIAGMSGVGLVGGSSYILFRIKRRRRNDGSAILRTPKDIEKELAESPTYLELQAMEAELKTMLAGKTSDEEAAEREVVAEVLERVTAQIRVERAIAERKLLGGYSRRLDQIFVERGQEGEYPTEEL
jgi:hypothetical protein